MTSNKKRRGIKNKNGFREYVGPNTSAKAFSNTLKRIKNQYIQNKRFNSSIDSRRRNFDCFLCGGIEKVQVKMDHKKKVAGIACEKCKKESYMTKNISTISRPIDIYVEWKEFVEKKPFYSQVKKCIVKIISKMIKKKYKKENEEDRTTTSASLNHDSIELCKTTIAPFIGLSKQEIVKRLIQEHKSYCHIKKNKSDLLKLIKDQIYPAVNLALIDKETFKKIWIKQNNNKKYVNNNNKKLITIFNLNT